VGEHDRYQAIVCSVARDSLEPVMRLRAWRLGRARRLGQGWQHSLARTLTTMSRASQLFTSYFTGVKTFLRER
jgi:hypothetical protein